MRPDPEKIAEGVKAFSDAGYTHVALVQIGDRQREFCEFYEKELKGALEKSL